MQLDRCDFPANPGKNVSNLIVNNLLYVSAANGFGAPFNYAVTTLGEKLVQEHLDHAEIIEHIKKMHNPDFMLELVEAIFSKMKK